MATDADLDYLTHPPDKAQIGIALAILRAISQALSGAGFAWAAADENDLVMLATSLVFLATTVWSVYQKFAARRKNRQASIQSAVQSAEATIAAGQPVAVVVTEPVPNPIPAPQL